MDKKDFKELIKALSRAYLYLFAIVGIPAIIIVGIISFLFNGESLSVIGLNIRTLGTAIFYLAMLIFGGMGIAHFVSLMKRKKETIKTENMVRELPEYFPPAIASFLLDLSLETTTDYTATIAYLISKKYIKLSKSEVNILNNSIVKLSSHEKYAFNCITGQNKYNHNEFKNLVMEDAEKMGYVKKGKRKIHFFRNFGLVLLIGYGFSFLYQYVFTTGFLNFICMLITLFALIGIVAVISYSIYLAKKYENESFFRTDLGEKEARRWTGLKKYLNEYTLVSEKKLEDITLLEEYIPYAISLNEAKAIEKFIEQNEEYRELIYGNIVNFNL